MRTTSATPPRRRARVRGFRGALALAAVGSLVAIAGCSAGTAGGGTEVPGAAGVPSPADSPTGGAGGDVRSNPLKFSYSRRQQAVTGAGGPMLYDGRYLVSPDPAKPSSTTITDTTTSKVVVRHTSANASSGWQVEDVFLVGAYAVVVDADPEPPYQPRPWFAATRYRLSDGSATKLAGRPALSGTAPEVYAADGDFAYTTDSGGRVCVATGTVASGTAATKYCSPPGWIPGYLRLDGSTLTFAETSQDSARTRAADGCRRLVRVPIGGSGPSGGQPVPTDQPCLQYAGAGGANWSVWTQASPSDTDPEQAPVVANTGGSARRMDTGTTGSLRSCGPWAYYLHRVDPNTVEIRRWKPGAAIESVYRSPNPTLSTTSPVSCANGWLSVMRQYSGTGTGYTELIAAQI